LTKIRLECPQQIEEDLAGLREDFLLNDKSKMLVLVSMATAEMIRLVSMYPEVWFMDTTAGECMFCLIYQRILLQFHNNSILDKCYYCNGIFLQQAPTGTRKNCLSWPYKHPVVKLSLAISQLFHLQRSGYSMPFSVDHFCSYLEQVFAP
jgi:hypothetical protein